MRKLLFALALGTALISPTIAQNQQQPPEANNTENDINNIDKYCAVGSSFRYENSAFMENIGTTAHIIIDEETKKFIVWADMQYRWPDKLLSELKSRNTRKCQEPLSIILQIDNERKLWPGEKPSAAAESTKNRPLIPEEKIQQQESNEPPQKAPDTRLAQKQELVNSMAECMHEAMKHPDIWGNEAAQWLLPECQRYKEALGQSMQHLPFPLGDAPPKIKRYPDNPFNPPPNATGNTRGNYR